MVSLKKWMKFGTNLWDLLIILISLTLNYKGLKGIAKGGVLAFKVILKNEKPLWKKKLGVWKWKQNYLLCLLKLLKEKKYEILAELHNMYADEEFIGCKDHMKGGCYREIITLPISILRRTVGKGKHIFILQNMVRCIMRGLGIYLMMPNPFTKTFLSRLLGI